MAGLLEPLPVNAPNFRERLDSLLAAMGADILGRVMSDKDDEDRSVLQYCLILLAHCRRLLVRNHQLDTPSLFSRKAPLGASCGS